MAAVKATQSSPSPLEDASLRQRILFLESGGSRTARVLGRLVGTEVHANDDVVWKALGSFHTKNLFSTYKHARRKTFCCGNSRDSSTNRLSMNYSQRVSSGKLLATLYDSSNAYHLEAFVVKWSGKLLESFF